MFLNPSGRPPLPIAPDGYIPNSVVWQKLDGYAVYNQLQPPISEDYYSQEKKIFLLQEGGAAGDSHKTGASLPDRNKLLALLAKLTPPTEFKQAGDEHEIIEAPMEIPKVSKRGSSFKALEARAPSVIEVVVVVPIEEKKKLPPPPTRSSRCTSTSYYNATCTPIISITVSRRTVV